MTVQELKSSVSIPVIAAPMFLISGVDLVVECCKNGVIGTFPSLNGKTSEDFEKMLIEITSQLKIFEKETGKKTPPFGVNLIVNKSNERLLEDIRLCVKYKVPLIITSLGAISELVKEIHGYGGLVFHDVIKKRHAEKAAEAGVDGIICVTAGAGGHSGLANPFALIREIKSFYNGALILAGSINNGNEVLAAEILNADFAYMGTRFINTKESMTSEAHKQMIIESEIGDIVYTDEISGVHGNFLLKSIENSESSNAASNDKKRLNLSKNKSSKAWKDVWSAGHGVTGIHDVLYVKELIEKLKLEYDKAKCGIQTKS